MSGLVNVGAKNRNDLSTLGKVNWLRATSIVQRVQYDGPSLWVQMS